MTEKELPPMPSWKF